VRKREPLGAVTEVLGLAVPAMMAIPFANIKDVAAVPRVIFPLDAAIFPAVAVIPVPAVTVVAATTFVPAFTVPPAKTPPRVAVIFPPVAVIPVPAVTVVLAATDPRVDAMLPVEEVIFPVAVRVPVTNVLPVVLPILTAPVPGVVPIFVAAAPAVLIVVVPVSEIGPGVTVRDAKTPAPPPTSRSTQFAWLLDIEARI